MKIDIIPNRLEKYMAFFLNKNLVFIHSMPFMNSNLEKLAKICQAMILNTWLKNLVLKT